TFSLFEVAAYALVALAGVASLTLLRHRFGQRSLLKIPGPSNPLYSGVIGTIFSILMPTHSMKGYTARTEK
ncbi:hypothetical protein EDB87DRAFT_1642202, partial [Lactarius vividus]